MLNRLPTIFFSCVLLTWLVFSGCNVTPPSPDPIANETPTRGTLRISHALIFNGQENLDPHSLTYLGAATTFLYDRLVRFDDTGQPAPDLATAWEANDEATAWTFTLREGVTFHDGKPFTSADVVYSFQHILDPATESPLAKPLALLETIEPLGEQQVVFNLNQSHADFPLLLTSFLARIIPENSGDTIAQTGIGTGPFKLDTVNVEGSSKFIANDEYWNGTPQLAAIELVAISEAEAQVAAALAGQIDTILSISAVQVALFEGNPAFNILNFPSGDWTSLVMRMDIPPFDDVRVRQAIRLAADRQGMIDLILDGQGTVSCDTPVSKIDIYRWETDCPQDIEKAKVLLAEAGYPDGLDVTLYSSDLVPHLISVAEVYQQQAKAAGINVTLEVVPADGYYTEVSPVQPFVTVPWRERPADLILNLVWRSNAIWNESHYDNPNFDQLLDAARAELDFETRRDLYYQAQQQLFDDGTHLILFHNNLANIVSNKVSGIEARNYREFHWESISKTQ